MSNNLFLDASHVFFFSIYNGEEKFSLSIIFFIAFRMQEAESALRMDELSCLHSIFENTAVEPFAHALLAKILLYLFIIDLTGF